MDSKSGGEGTKEGNGTQETNGFIHNVILQHVRCVIRQSTETVFMVVVCVMGGGRLRKLNNMVQHLILVKRRHFPYPLLLSGSAAKSGQRAGRSGKAQCCVPLAGARG